MLTLLLCLILMPFFINTSGMANHIFQASNGVEDVRAQLRRVWSEFVRHSTIRYKPLATGVQLRYVVFYKSSMQHSIAPRQAVCIDRRLTKGAGADTCEKQRNARQCKARFSGILKDGLCARTCGLCEIRNFGMRTTFEFITNKTRTKGKRKGQKIHDLVTLEMQSTGHWRFYKTHSDTLGTGVQCQSNSSVPLAMHRRLQTAKSALVPKNHGPQFYEDPTECMHLVIAQCEQMEYFEWDPEKKICGCIKRISGTLPLRSSSEHQRMLSTSEGERVLYNVNCTVPAKSLIPPPNSKIVGGSNFTFFPGRMKQFFDRIWRQTVAKPLNVQDKRTECIPAKTTNLSALSNHSMTVHPGITLRKEDQGRNLSYLYQIDDKDDNRISIAPHLGSVLCVNNKQTRAVCKCPFGDPAKGFSCARDAVKCRRCWTHFHLSARPFDLVGTGIAGPTEVWNVSMNSTLKSSDRLEACFSAVKADSRCAGDYFTYALVEGCGCKGSGGKLTVRASAQAMMFKISEFKDKRSICVLDESLLLKYMEINEDSGRHTKIFPRKLEILLRVKMSNASKLQPVCAGQKKFLTTSEAPSNFCTLHSTRFNQYTLEHVMLQRWINTTWSIEINMVAVASPMFNIPYKKGAVDWTKIDVSVPKSRSFWNDIKKRFYKPKERYTPVIVVHSPFAWNSMFLRLLTTLLKMQPPAFVDRVIIASLDGSNIPEFLVQKLAKRKSGKPLLVTLPYPVGVISVGNFSESREKYHPIARRNITLGFIGKDRTELRRFLRSQFKSAGGNVTGSNAYKCAPGHESLYCGLPDKPSVYQMVANTDFCLEPTGDTPTRSHFYLAVLAGCIPVIFDFDRGKALRRNIHVAGVTGKKYFPYQKTQWAWRYDPREEFRLNYSTFTVTYNAQDILRNRTNILEELYSMPSREPERFRSLRLGVSRAAKRMYYGLKDCSSENCDAFKIFKDIVIARARQLNEIKYSFIN